MILNRINIYQATAVNAFSPQVWTIAQAEKGWLAKRGEAILISTISKKIRFFSTADVAIRRLQSEAGITQFEVSPAH